MEVKNLRQTLNELHVKHITLTGELQSHRDADAKNKAEIKRLRGMFALIFFLCVVCGATILNK